MPLTTNKIHVFEFISLQGQPILPAQQTLVDDRPGVDGSEFIVTGVKGTPFSLVSQVDAENYEAAKHYLADYQQLVGFDAVELIQGGVSSDSDGYRVVVLKVEAQRIMTILGASGNALNPPSFGFIEARWDLIAVPFEE